MSVVPYNVVLGPATLYAAPFGTTFPTDASFLSVPSAPWTDVGGTTGGVSVDIDETITGIKVDQVLDEVGARVTARTISVVTTFMENQLANFSLALNQATTSGSGVATGGENYATLDMEGAASGATQPLYTSLIVDGWAPTLSTGAAARRRFTVAKVLSTPKISEKYDMANAATLAVTFTAYYVSSDVSPIHIIDQIS
jgi:hypothetical protein